MLDEAELSLEESMADYDAIVVGSGAGGLSAALEVARSGFSVLVLEAMPSFGGYLNPFRRKQYSFDTGLHYMGELGQEGRFRNLLEGLGISVDFVELDPDGFDRYVFPDFELQLCKGKERFEERLVRLFPEEERGIHRYFEIYDSVLRATQASESMGEGLLKKLGFILRNPIMMKYGRVPYQRLLDEVTADRRLQAALAAIHIDYGLSPAKASVVVAVLLWDHYLKGAYYPSGGSGAFRDAFINGLETCGAELRNRSRVVRIDKRGEEFVVETEPGEKHTAKVVISDADPVITLGKLLAPEMVPTKTRKKAIRLCPSIGCFYAFVGTDLDLPSVGITNANIVHYDTYDINATHEHLENGLIPEKVPFFLLTSPSVKDPAGGHATSGYSTLEIITLVGYKVFEKWANLASMHRGEEYERLKEKIGERLIAAAERYVPGLSEHLDCVEYATPLTNEYWVNAVQGGMYGPAQTPDQMGPGRFSSFTAGIDGLFLVGSGTLAGGIMPCVASGVLAGKKAAGTLGG